MHFDLLRVSLSVDLINRADQAAHSSGPITSISPKMDTDDVAARIRLTDPAAAAASAPRPAAPQAGPSFAPPPKLEPFLLLAKSARGAGAAKLIEQATAAPGVYVFAELIESSCIVDVSLALHLSSRWLLAMMLVLMKRFYLTARLE